MEHRPGLLGKVCSTTYAVPLLLLLVAIAFFWCLWCAPDGFLYTPKSDYSDLTITHWPNALFVRRSLATWGQVPLWRPLILGGEPFAANPLSGLWYLPNLLLLMLPLNFAFNLLFVLHTAWSGWGAYRLVQSTGGSQCGGLLAAFAVMLSPKAVAHLAAGHVGLYFSWAWLPWVLWAVRRLAKRGRSDDLALAAATVAMMVLADVRLGFYGGLAAAGYWVVNLKSLISNLKLQIVAAAGAVFLAGALVSVQIIPLAAVSGRLNRGGLTLEESAIASLPPSYLLGLVVADHGGFQETMTYLGAVGLLLALLGLVLWQGRERWWWGGLVLGALVYSLGTNTPLYSLLYRILPPLGWLRGPARAWFLVVLSAAVLAAHGLTEMDVRFLDRRLSNRAAVGLVGAALTGVVGGMFLGLTANVVAAAVIWPLAGLLAVLKAGGRLRRSRFMGLLLALALLDLCFVGWTLYRVRPADEVQAEGEAAAAWLAQQSGEFRVYSPSYSIPQHTGAVYGLEMVDGVDPFQLVDTVDYMRAATGVDLPGYSVTLPAFPKLPPGEEMLLAHRDVEPNLHLLGMLNVRYLATAYPVDMDGLGLQDTLGGVYVYQNEQALPRAFVVAGDLPVEVWRPQSVTEAVILEHTPNAIHIQAQGPGLLVLSEIYDPDWRVRVDGACVQMLRLAEVLRGVYLPEGSHRVTFSYWPVGLTLGLGVTAVGWLCAAALMLLGRKKSRP